MEMTNKTPSKLIKEERKTDLAMQGSMRVLKAIKTKIRNDIAETLIGSSTDNEAQRNSIVAQPQQTFMLVTTPASNKSTIKMDFNPQV